VHEQGIVHERGIVYGRGVRGPLPSFGFRVLLLTILTTGCAPWCGEGTGTGADSSGRISLRTEHVRSQGIAVRPTDDNCGKSCNETAVARAVSAPQRVSRGAVNARKDQPLRIRTITVHAHSVAWR